MAHLVVEAPDGRQQRIRLERDETVLGRELSCDVCLPDPKVSRRHARIVRDGQGHFIEDLGSVNGYLFDGQGVHGRSRLRHGSELGFGDYKLRYEADEAAAKLAGTRSGQRAAAAKPAAPAARGGAAEGGPGGYTLRVVEGELVGQTFALTGAQLIVGRSGDADVVLDDPSISRRHASLSPGADGVEVRDLGSSNGTFFEGQQTQHVRLRTGQSVRFGSLMLRLDGPPAPTAQQRRHELSQSTRDAAERMRAELPSLARPSAGGKDRGGGVAAAAERAHAAIDRASGSANADARPAAPRRPAGPSALRRALAGAGKALRALSGRGGERRRGRSPWGSLSVVALIAATLGATYVGRHRLAHLVRFRAGGQSAASKGAPAGLGDVVGTLLGHSPSAEELAFSQRLERKLAAAASKLKAEAFADAAELYGQVLLDEPIEPAALLGRRLAVARLAQREDLTGGRGELQAGHPFEALVAASAGLNRGLASAEGPPLTPPGARPRDAEVLGDEPDAAAPKATGKDADAEEGELIPAAPHTTVVAVDADDGAGPSSAERPGKDLPEDPTLHHALEALVDQGAEQMAQACGERAQAACTGDNFASCLSQAGCLAAFDATGELGPALRAMVVEAVGAEAAPGPATAALSTTFPQPALRRAMLTYAAAAYPAALKLLANVPSPKARALQADVAQLVTLVEAGQKAEQAGQLGQALGIYEQAETIDRRLLPREVPSAPRQEFVRRAQRIYLRQGEEARARGAYAEALAAWQRGQAMGPNYPPLVHALAGLHARAQKLLLQAGPGAHAAERKDVKGDPCNVYREVSALVAPGDSLQKSASTELAACVRKRGKAKK